MCRCADSTTAFDLASVPISGGSGCSSSMYRQMATDSSITVPSSSTRVGSRLRGLIARKSADRFSPVGMSTWTVVYLDTLLGEKDPYPTGIGRHRVFVQLHRASS